MAHPSSILILPPEILADIFSFLHGEHLARLKLTGTKNLWHKICVSGVVKRLVLPSYGILFRHVPSFVNELIGLSSIIFDNQNECGHLEMSVRLTFMPKQLRKLQILRQIQNPGVLFHNSNVEPINVSQYLPHLEELEYFESWMNQEPWMSTLPTSLKKLKTGAYSLSVPLPTQIETFECLELHPPIIPFPKVPHLTSLSIGKLQFVMSFVLPSSLTYLSIKSAPRSSLDMIFISQLPRALKYLRFPYGYENSPLVSVSEAAAAWPPSLETLNTERFPLELWPSLPHSLTSFTQSLPMAEETYTALFQNDHLYESMWNSLPPNLTLLDVSMSAPVALPRRLPVLASLTSLHLPWNYFCDGTPDSDLRQFMPPSLKDLHIWDASPALITVLPRNLKSFALQQVYLKPELFTHLPNSLTDLSLFSTSSYCTIIDQFTGQPNLLGFTDSESSPEFPPPVPWGSLPEFCLPFHMLQSLILTGPCNINDATLLHLPRGLISLEISESTISDSGMAFISRHALRRLDLGTKGFLTGECFGHLPETLEWLNFPENCEEIEDRHIELLPRKLRTLAMLKAIKLTALCLPKLPPLLMYWDVRNNDNFKTSDIPSFPFRFRRKGSSPYGFKHVFICNSFEIRQGSTIKRKPFPGIPPPIWIRSED